MQLTYYIKQFDQYKPLLTYKSPDNIHEDEIYARQLCGYFVVEGSEYECLSNEIEGGEDVIVVQELGPTRTFSDEKNYKPLGLHIEFREYQQHGDMPLIIALPCETHWDIIRYLLKDVVFIPGLGSYVTDSTEIDEDRHVYVMYVNKMGEVV